MEDIRVEVCTIQPCHGACLRIYSDLVEQLMVISDTLEGGIPEEEGQIDCALGPSENRNRTTRSQSISTSVTSTIGYF